MKHKLFWYMLALAVIVLSFLGCGLFFFGHFSTAKESVENNLAFQMRTYERQVSKYFEDMTRMGNSLSYSVAQKTDAYLASEGIEFDDLNDDSTRIAALQNILFDKLGIELMKTDCSGAFLILNATVNTYRRRGTLQNGYVLPARFSRRNRRDVAPLPRHFRHRTQPWRHASSAMAS